MLRSCHCPRNFKEANATATLADYCRVYKKVTSTFVNFK